MDRNKYPLRLTTNRFWKTGNYSLCARERTLTAGGRLDRAVDAGSDDTSRGLNKG